MEYTNAQMAEMIGTLEKHLPRRDVIGYAAARNTRVLSTAAREFLERREELMAEYGEIELDENGNPTGRISIAFDSPNFKPFSDVIAAISDITTDVDILRVKYEQVIGQLTGTEILELEWMLED